MKKSLLKSGLLTLMLGATASLTATAGNTPYTLPFDFEPTAANFSELITIDANGDGTGTTNAQWAIKDGALTYTYHERNSADDWAIFPTVDFGNSTKVTVELQVKAGGYPEKFEVKLGKERTIAGMTLNVMSEVEKGNTATNYSAEVELPEDTDNIWALGIHAISDADKNTLTILNVKITGDGSGDEGDDDEGDITTGGLPFTFEASQANFNSCVIIDANGDDIDNNTYANGIWSYASNPGAFKYTYNMENYADDWLILPPVDFGKSTAVKVSFEAQSAYDTESFEVKLGKERTADAMTLAVLSEDSFCTRNQWQTLSAEVKLDGTTAREADDNIWALGIHATSAPFMSWIYIRNIKIESVAITTGIESVEAEAVGEREYFNLQGQRVATPRAGELLIVREGQRVYKTVIR